MNGVLEKGERVVREIDGKDFRVVSAVPIGSAVVYTLLATDGEGIVGGGEIFSDAKASRRCVVASR